MKHLALAALLALVIALPVFAPVFAQSDTVADLAARGWRADQIASSPDWPAATATMTTEEYSAFLRDLIAYALETQNVIITLEGLRQQGVPSSLTCRIARNGLLDRGVNVFNRGNLMAQFIQRTAGCAVN